MYWCVVSHDVFETWLGGGGGQGVREWGGGAGRWRVGGQRVMSGRWGGGQGVSSGRQGGGQVVRSGRGVGGRG